MIFYRTGDATDPVESGQRVIIHICNDAGFWAKGFVRALSARWPEPERDYRIWCRRFGDSGRPPFKLGEMCLVRVRDDLLVANLLAQHGIRPSVEGEPPIRYWALREALQKMHTALEKPYRVVCPRLGTGLAGGTWSEVERILHEELCQNDVPVTVYTLPPGTTPP